MKWSFNVQPQFSLIKSSHKKLILHYIAFIYYKTFNDKRNESLTLYLIQFTCKSTHLSRSKINTINILSQKYIFTSERDEAFLCYEQKDI